MDRDGESGIDRFRRDNEAFKLPKGDYAYVMKPNEIWIVDDIGAEEKPVDPSLLDFWFKHIQELAGVNLFYMGTPYRYPLSHSFHRSADETND